VDKTMNNIPEGYKQTEVGVIPEGWEVKTLGELTTLLTNGFVGKVTDQYTDSDDGVLYIQGFNVEENSFNFYGIKRVTLEFHKQHAKSYLLEGDLLTIQTGDIGVTTVIPKELEGSNCHALIISRFKKGQAIPKFFSYYFNSFYGRNRLKEIETGTTMKHLNVGDMIKWLIPCPPLPEQTAIASALTDVDALITALGQLITKKRNIKQGAMQQLLTGKKRLPGFGGKWEVKKLGEIFKITAGGDFKEQFSSNDEDERHCYPIYSNSVSNRGLYGYSTYFVYEANSITVTARGTIGVANMRNHKFTAIGRVIVLKPEYPVDCFFASEFINNRINFVVETTGVPQLTAPQISLYEISLPSHPEQQAIAQILSDMDTEIETLEQKQAKYKAIKQGMMQQLLTGKTRLV